MMRRLFPKLFTVLMAACFAVALAGCEHGHDHGVKESGKCCGNPDAPGCCAKKASCAAGCKCAKCV